MIRLLDFLFPPRADEIALRGVSDEAFLALSAPTIIPETSPETVALFSFSDPRVRAAIHEAKYHGNERALKLLAAAIADYLRDCDDVGYRMSNTYIIPVPLGTKRRRERGFNQAEEVAKYAARELKIKLRTDLLVRTRETDSQVSLRRRKREENMRGAFGAARPTDPAHTYIVIDDVITTGATLQASIDALREAGAEHIIPLALAH